ncbi:uncharacterized protein Bfra_008600 [Botrytis fragariae]|uniref:Secreted protein n=1 Tax=Botrytis fragariae TaxID=1964551 RepID=A0A8H6EIC2_9HELO|nr:uncharacterized protein Bfra_008600 [Botrytis fragariae]KAF5873318.1 hypothetical protein Bfra_008600 [Botrytis fragariae]
MHPPSILIFGFAAVRAVFGTPIPVRNIFSHFPALMIQTFTHSYPHDARAIFVNSSKRLPTSSGNITAYGNNAHIESHLSKRSSESNESIECPEGFTPRDGSKIVPCVSIHLKLEKQS